LDARARDGLQLAEVRGPGEALQEGPHLGAAAFALRLPSGAAVVRPGRPPPGDLERRLGARGRRRVAQAHDALAEVDPTVEVAVAGHHPDRPVALDGRSGARHPDAAPG